MAWIFKIKERSGRDIHLSKERWNHITIEHPKLANNIEYIKDTVKKPLTVRKSKNDEHVRFYYKQFKELSKYLLVSVKYLNGEGFVITAFYTSKLTK